MLAFDPRAFLDKLVRLLALLFAFSFEQDSLTNIDMLQERQVQRRADDIRCPLREDDMAAIVALVHCVQDIRRVIGLEIIVALHIAVPAARRALWERLIRLLGREADFWSLALVLRDAVRQTREILFVRRPSRERAGGLQQQGCRGGFEQHLDESTSS